jgi:hypothetical protein
MHSLATIHSPRLIGTNLESKLLLEWMPEQRLAFLASFVLTFFSESSCPCEH